MYKTEVCHVQNLREPDRSWCLRWQSPYMRASAFWYFATEDEARAAEHTMTGGRKSSAGEQTAHLE